MPEVKYDQRYLDSYLKWALIRSISSGDILNEKVWKILCYLPESAIEKAGKKQGSTRTKLRQAEFVKGAKLFPAVGRTVAGSVGSVFRRPSEITLQSELEYMLSNANGAGVGIEQISKDVTSENTEIGYGGILTDFAEGSGGTRGENEDGNRLATITIYKAESIARVSTKEIGSAVVVSSVVLRETKTKEIGPFESVLISALRVLKYDANGDYIQEYYEDEEEDGFTTVRPLDASGNPFKSMPFVFFGSISNTPSPSVPPVFALATLNKKHLEYSAMRNESIRQHAPTMFLELQEGITAKEWNEDNPKGITMGSWGSYIGFKSVEIIQATPNDASSEEMKTLREEMIEAGASLVTPSVSNVSAETAHIQRSTDTSVLGGIVRNAEEAMNDSLNFASMFMSRGEQGKSTITLNRDFIDSKMGADMTRAWSDLVMKGQVTDLEFRKLLEKDGMIEDAEAVESSIIIDENEGA